MNPDAKAATVKALAENFERAWESGDVPVFDGRRIKLFVLACQQLLDHGRLAAGEHAIRHLYAAHPTLHYAATMAAVFDCTPDGPAPLIEFSDDPDADVQVIHRTGCDAVMLVFCGRLNRPGLPMQLIHRWFGRLPVSIIYLRDFQKLVGGAGYPSLGSNREATVESLKSLISHMGARRIYAYGNSGGSFPALHYGLNLGAKAVLCMAGPTNLTAEFNRNMTAFSRELTEGPLKLPEYAVDMRQLYAVAEQPPRVLYVYGTGFWNDRLWAENMKGLPSVELVPVEDCAEHKIVAEVLRRGLYPDLLRRFMAAGEN